MLGQYSLLKLYFLLKGLTMLRFGLAILPLFFAVEAHALTFKSGGSVNGGEPALNSAEIEAAIAACQSASPLLTSQEPMQVMSFNIRYDNSGDGKNNWKFRAPKVASMFQIHDVALGGLQEALHHQLDWLQEALPDYEFVGVGRDDGKTEGEYAPVFFRKAEFELLNSDTIWLSKTPNKPGSKGWDAALPRITTFATLRHKASDTKILLASAHYDHRGSRARVNSGKVIHDYITETLASEDLPLVILTGDFNDRPNSATTRAIENKNCLFDARRIATDVTGPNSTWNGFRTVAAYERLDYVFLNPSVPVMKHVIDDRRIENRYPSDHLPVIVSIGTPK